MTDTSTQAVKKLAAAFQRWQTKKAERHAVNPRYAAPDDRWTAIPDLLVMLVNERDAAQAALKQGGTK